METCVSINAYHTCSLELTHSFNKCGEHLFASRILLFLPSFAIFLKCGRNLHSSLGNTANAMQAVPWDSWL